MKRRLTDEIIAMRAAREFKDGYYVNLGGGIPLLCSSFLPEGADIWLHAEQGSLGYGPLVFAHEADQTDFDYVDAGTRPVHPKAGLCFFDLAVSFDIIRGGHLDLTVLGAYQVSEKGDLANWCLPGDILGGIGGGMDLAACSRRVIVCMHHTADDGSPKILKECTLPLSAREAVDLIVTDLAVIDVTTDGLVLKEVAPGWTAEEVQARTGAPLRMAPDLREISL